jgi:hypothetical protein
MIRPSSTTARASVEGLGPRWRVRMIVDGVPVPAWREAVWGITAPPGTVTSIDWPPVVGVSPPTSRPRQDFSSSAAFPCTNLAIYCDKWERDVSRVVFPVGSGGSFLATRPPKALRVVRCCR